MSKLISRPVAGTENWKAFHTREAVSSTHVEWRRGFPIPDHLKDSVFGMLARTRGVAAIRCYGYETQIAKGEAFDWERDQIEAKILEVLSIFDENQLPG